MRLFLLFLMISCSVFSQKNIKEYVTKNNTHLKVGDTITFHLPSSPEGFVYITQGNLKVHPSRAGAKGIVQKIKVFKNGLENQAFAYIKGFGLLPVIVDIENAIIFNEIVLP